MTETRTVTQEALDILDGKRDEYGVPERNFEAVADMWQTYLNNRKGQTEPVLIYPEDVALMMALLKIVRESSGHKRDNFVDGIAYFDIAYRIKEGTE